MKARLQTWCLIIGMVMLGPIMFGFAITCLIVGEIPGRWGPLVKAVDHPIFFYIAVIAFIVVTAKFAQVTLIAARFFYRQAKQRRSL